MSSSSLQGKTCATMTHLVFLSALFCVLFVTVCSHRQSELTEAYTWKLLDFQFEDKYHRQQAIYHKEFIPEHNLPVGIEIWGSKIFVTIPKWRTGVPASLAYIDTTYDPTRSPLLKPYPNWAAHNQSCFNPYRIVSPIRVRVDSCNRLWILDSGQSDLLGDLKVLSFPQIIVYDLLTDKRIRNFTLPQNQFYERSRFVTIAVDVLDCTKTWAYLADFSGPSLVVYDWQLNKSWRVKDHEYFAHNPIAVNFKVSGTNFAWMDGIFSLALSEIDWKTNDRTLFFHPFSSFEEFYASTQILRSEEQSNHPSSKYAFKRLGSRGFNSQSGPSYVSEEHGILFFSLVNQDAIGCWNYRHQTRYFPDTQGLVAVDNRKLIFPNDLKVDSYDNLWVLSNNMQKFIFSSLYEKDVNFRILVAPIDNLIRNTKCDPTFLSS